MLDAFTRLHALSAMLVYRAHRVETANEGAKVSGAPPLRNWLKALARVQEEEQQDPARVHDLDM